MKCDKCKCDMKEEINESSIVYICPKCGNKIASTYNKGIYWDSKLYSIFIDKNQSIKKDNLKFVSNITGLNYMKSKDLLINGGLLKKARAEIIFGILLEIKKNKIDINVIIDPDFKYLKK